MGTGISAVKKLELFPDKIIDLKEIGSGGFILRLPRRYDFEAGQVIGLSTRLSLEPRLYSIASGENDKEQEILFTRKDDGQLTPALSELAQGDTVYSSRPFGNYTHVTPGCFWIATGTGLAPFRSMLRSGKGKDAFFLHGARDSASFYFSEEFRESLSNRYVPCSSTGAGGCFPGRVSDWLLQADELPLDKQFYLCGRAEMVVEVRDILISKGISFKNIHAEIYF